MKRMGWYKSLSENEKVAGIGGMVPGMGKFLLNFSSNASLVDSLVIMSKAGVTALVCAFMTVMGKQIYDRLIRDRFDRLIDKYISKKTRPPEKVPGVIPKT